MMYELSFRVHRFGQTFQFLAPVHASDGGVMSYLANRLVHLAYCQRNLRGLFGSSIFCQTVLQHSVRG